MVQKYCGELYQPQVQKAGSVLVWVLDDHMLLMFMQIEPDLVEPHGSHIPKAW